MELPSFTKAWHSTMYPAIDSSKPSLSSKGKNIVITGGGTGIGAATAYHFARSGASSVVIIGRRPDPLIATQTLLKAEFPNVNVLYFSADIVDKAITDATFKDIHAQVGEIHVLINNAGYLSDPAPFKDADAEEWWKSFEINIKGSLLVTQAFLRYNTPDATIVYVSSAMAHLQVPIPGVSSYRAAKAGGTVLFDCVQQENPGLRVVNVQPGILATEMASKNGPNALPAVDDPSLPAAFMVWIASPEADFAKGKFLWANWDVEELASRKEEIQGSNLLTLGLAGWPFPNMVKVF